MSARRLVLAAALFAAGALVDVVGCDPGDPTVLPPPDSSWLDFGVDAADETLACPSSDTGSIEGVVATDHGPVRGAKTTHGWSFLGIPYAAPPVGDLRWRPPQSAPCWSDALDATKPAPRCPQSDASGSAPVQGDEDCLHVNVFTPSTSASNAPVIVFAHGGGFTIGAASDVDGGALAQSQNVVVVTFDHRLGALGFLSQRAFDVEDPRHASGNYGALDAIAALQWVRRNVAAFGGDPEKVTLVGQDSGATLACALLASPLAKGLFSKAILMSGSCEARSVSDAQKQGDAVVAAAGCNSAPDVAQCMRALPANKIISAAPVVVGSAAPDSPYGVNVDGTLLSGKPIDVISAGGHQQMPVVLGNTTNETSRDVGLAMDATESDYEAAIASAFATNKDAVLAQYPASDYASPWSAWVALTSDALHVCPTREIARAFLDGQDLPFYRYSFAHGSDRSEDVAYGAWQGVDLLYLFGGLPSPSSAESVLAVELQGTWARFASLGDPNGPPLPTWPAWSDDDSVFVFDVTLSTQNGLRNKQCDFWASLAP